jgi:hypothetical protein
LIIRILKKNKNHKNNSYDALSPASPRGLSEVLLCGDRGDFPGK